MMTDTCTLERSYVELYVAFTLIGNKWTAWTSTTKPTKSINTYIRRIRIPVPKELITLRSPDAELIKPDLGGDEYYANVAENGVNCDE